MGSGDDHRLAHPKELRRIQQSLQLIHPVLGEVGVLPGVDLHVLPEGFDVHHLIRCQADPLPLPIPGGEESRVPAVFREEIFSILPGLQAVGREAGDDLLFLLRRYGYAYLHGRPLFPLRVHYNRTYFLEKAWETRCTGTGHKLQERRA